MQGGVTIVVRMRILTMNIFVVVAGLGRTTNSSSSWLIESRPRQGSSRSLPEEKKEEEIVSYWCYRLVEGTVMRKSNYYHPFYMALAVFLLAGIPLIEGGVLIGES